MPEPEPLIATLIASPQRRNLDIGMANELSNRLGKDAPDWLAEAEACDIALEPGIDPEKARAILADMLSGQSIDFAIQRAAGRRKRALIADMDSTMIEQECIDELAAEIGVKEHVAAITARAMNGEIEFEPALRERVALLEGLAENITEKVIEERITLAAGGMTLLATMRASGAYCALVSGGFTHFTGPIAAMLGFDENRANRLETVESRLTGRVREPILGADAKVAALEEIASKRSLATSEFLAVGDGANDLPMLGRAGTGVALHAKPSVAAQAKIRIDHGDLTALLYLQGYRKREFAKI